MNQPVRVRFAPSPTGGLHIGGVRTILYNWLFARQHNGTFILRIEDTDQNRFVAGAEEYIFQCLEWTGLTPDESTQHGGSFAPYRQSERKEIYREYAEQLVSQGHAYYAFDTTDDLEKMRQDLRTEINPTPQYDHRTRMQMRNSLSLSKEETDALLKANTAHVIRIKMPEEETISFHDMVRGDVSFNTGLSDDKVLLKADGMPTYHLAVVVDDRLMQITHAFRGEEWLPSAPVHLMLWKYFGWEKEMPQWAHLPLIMKPDGHGKLSKRDGDRLGFPVFAMDWTDPRTGETATGFREKGFLPAAFLNMLAVLGWNDGSEKELFSLEELKTAFSMDRVHKSGAKFDYEKAKWFNHQYLQQMNEAELVNTVKPWIEKEGVAVDDQSLSQVIHLIKDRCSLLPDFWEQGSFFFKRPEHFDLSPVREKWNAQKEEFFKSLVEKIGLNDATAESTETLFTDLVAASGLKKGDVMLPLRIMLVGGKFGPGVFDIIAVIGKNEAAERIKIAIDLLTV